MVRSRAHNARHWRRSISWLLSCAALITGTGTMYGQDVIVRVEEDWELVLHTPETTSNSPQITCAMSPLGSDDNCYMSFELNHQSQPGYEWGGLHLHAWDGEYLYGSAHSQPGVVLRETGEALRWTQVMSVQDGSLTYEICGGTSATWGEFGHGELRLSIPGSVANLNGYQVEHSLNGSGVGFGANRVQSLVLKRVRLVTSTGEVTETVVDEDVVADEESNGA